jgi:hypothetical protein
VIGGLLSATFATLIFVPVVYSILRRKQPRDLTVDFPPESAVTELSVVSSR